MDKYNVFEKKVRAMSAFEIIMTMVNSIRNPVTILDMDTFGFIDKENDESCYGCAATNFICRVSEINPKDHILSNSSHVLHGSFVDIFETCIDCLRQGDIDAYNHHARRIKIVEIQKEPEKIYSKLCITNLCQNMESKLLGFERLAEYNS